MRTASISRGSSGGVMGFPPVSTGSYMARLGAMGRGNEELRDEYGNYFEKDSYGLPGILRQLYAQSGKRFVFIIDERDCVFRIAKEKRNSIPSWPRPNWQPFSDLQRKKYPHCVIRNLSPSLYFRNGMTGIC